MAIPRTNKVEFEVGGVKLYHHFAQDSHGAISNTYMADGHLVKKEEFLKIIRDSLEGAEHHVALALGMIRVGK